MIKTNSIKAYYLNAKFFSDRKSRMDSYLTELGFNFERIESDSDHPIKQIRIAQGFIKLAEAAIHAQIFPFLILEDDISVIDFLPDSIDIPSDCDLLYLGASLWECGGIKPKLMISERSDSFYRIRHSLGCHAILVPNKKSAEHFIKINDKAVSSGEHVDILFAIESANSIYLTPKDGPYFYQTDPHTEPITKFKWSTLNPLPLV
jgi:hypothetical protein